jgi:hypothetical protein
MKRRSIRGLKTWHCQLLISYWTTSQNLF